MQQEILNGIAEQNKEIYEGRMRRKSTRILPFSVRGTDMGVTKNDSTMKSEADQTQRKNLEVENQQDKNEKSSTAGKKSNGKDTGTYKERLKEITAVLHKHAITRGVSRRSYASFSQISAPPSSSWDRSCPCAPTFCPSATATS